MPKKLKKPDRLTSVKKGLVICYIGAGKGKTTAAMGVAVRAAGAGMNVFILQFIKARVPKEGEKRQGGEWPVSSEIDFFNSLGYNKNTGLIKSEQMGLGFVGILGDQKEREVHIKEAINGLNRAREIMISGEYEVIILDEIISALELKLIQEQDILDLISSKPEMIHLVMTGHEKFPKIIKACDLVTEMKMLKHPYYEGILAQRGIDY